MSTPTVTQTFQHLHRVRKHLRELKSEIDLGPRVMAIQQQKLDNEKQAHKDAHDIIGKLKLKIRDDEGTLKQLNTQLAKFEKQLNDAGSPKEYEGKQSEIRQAKENIATTEEAILAGMEELEQKTAALPAADKQWADAQAEFEQFKIDAKDRLQRMQDDQKTHQELLATHEAALPPAVKSQYDRLVKSYGADCLAGVDGRSCQQCRNALTEQQRVELTAGKFICCPRCGRGLYPAG
jgi:predicted  nucleic acid-binding Zn-ribbon protein